MIELKRLKLINWHNFENVTFDCARLTYMIGVNAVGKTTILDAIRYCLTTNRYINALGNKKSGRTLQGSVHAKQRGENAYRRPGRTVAYIGAEFWDSVKRTHFVIAVRVESEGPMQELPPGAQTWYISEDGCTLEQLPFIDPRTGAPSSKENFKPAVGRLSYTRSPGEARDRICRALGIGRAASPLGKKFNEVFQMGTSMDEIPNFREFLYQYILPQPELDLEALQGDRVELENLHAVLAEAQTRAAALETIVNDGREAAEKETAALVNRGAALLARAAADAGEDATWQGHLEAGNRQLETLNAQYEAAKEKALASADVAKQLDIDTLATLIYAQNFSMPAGYVKDSSGKSWLMKVGEEYDSVADIEGALLLHVDGFGDVRLSDVADVEVIDNAEASYTRLNGERAAVLKIFKISTASASTVSDSCLEVFKELEAQYGGLKVVVLSNQGNYITVIVKSILTSMIVGAALAIIVLAIFLKDIKPTLVVGISFPLSVLFAFEQMYFTGLDLNVMTLAGLSLGIAMLVENSVVVIENIYRLRGRGVPAPRAAVQGAKQVGMSIVASTLTSVCVFVPVIFTSETVRNLMQPLSLCIGYCLLAALIVAITVVPAAASTVLK